MDSTVVVGAIVGGTVGGAVVAGAASTAADGWSSVAQPATLNIAAAARTSASRDVDLLGVCISRNAHTLCCCSYLNGLELSRFDDSRDT
jgi:hypothetical protein